MPSMGATLGAVYIGSTIATIITNLQAINYYKKYPDDWWVYRYSVGILWCIQVHLTIINLSDRDVT
ncbi:hypothetical protein ARMGADRAFT_1087027 [Armillaria gallica]|uniref:Uncharacterized protein n=1 Tax=Armillaria gallica TaxID=47427 RepID=A0A2H3DEU0_ARMGA|nr:hypothetical protein ARMGADRAFT_1088379 [Armillaria gallica]PBK85996.1 hypothetical protein ARMGADRAFT_1087027 [Armillaria gallica]